MMAAVEGPVHGYAAEDGWIAEAEFRREFGDVDLRGEDPVPIWRADDLGRLWVNLASARAWWAAAHPGEATLHEAQVTEDESWRGERDDHRRRSLDRA